MYLTTNDFQKLFLTNLNNDRSKIDSSKFNTLNVERLVDNLELTFSEDIFNYEICKYKFNYNRIPKCIRYYVSEYQFIKLIVSEILHNKDKRIIIKQYCELFLRDLNIESKSVRKTYNELKIQIPHEFL